MNRRPPLRTLAALALLLLLAACSGAGTKVDARDRTLYAYSAAIRWGDIDGALIFVDPAYTARHPFTTLDRERFEQVQVTGYYIKGTQEISDTEIGQRVEIRLVNRHTQAERSVIDDQIWRWDAATKTWLLTTGLPRIAETR